MPDLIAETRKGVVKIVSRYTPTGLHADCDRFWLYCGIRKRFQTGEL